MSSKGYAGRGAKLQTSPDGGAYTTIAQLRRFAFGGMRTTMVDATDISSAGIARKLAVLFDGGDVTYSGILNPADTTINNLLTRQAGLTRTFFQLLLPDGSALKFQGFISEHVPADVDYSKAIVFSGKITIDGAVAFVPVGGGGGGTGGGGFQHPGFQIPGFQ